MNALSTTYRFQINEDNVLIYENDIVEKIFFFVPLLRLPMTEILLYGRQYVLNLVQICSDLGILPFFTCFSMNSYDPKKIIKLMQIH